MPTPNSSPRAFKVVAASLTVRVLAACGNWLLARRQAYPQAVRRLPLLGAAWYLITIAPMVVTYSSARHLYITSAGLSIALASLILPGPRRTAPSDEDSNGDGRSADRPLRSGVELERVRVGCQRHRVKALCLGPASPGCSRSLVAASCSWTCPNGVALALVLVLGDAVRPAASLHGRRPVPRKFEIVERPMVYCCPPDQWWAAKKSTLTALMDAPAPQHVIYIVSTPDHPGALTVTTRPVDVRR